MGNISTAKPAGKRIPRTDLPASPEAIAAFERVSRAANALCAYAALIRQHEEKHVKPMDDSEHISNAMDFLHHAAGEIEQTLTDIVFAERNGVQGVVKMLSTLPVIAIPDGADRTVTLPAGVNRPHQLARLREVASRCLATDEDIIASVRDRPLVTIKDRQLQLEICEEAMKHFHRFRHLIDTVISQGPGIHIDAFCEAQFVYRIVDIISPDLDAIADEIRSNLNLDEAMQIEDAIKEKHSQGDADE